MADNDTLKPRSFRTTDATAESLKKIVEEGGFQNQNEMLLALIDVWEEATAKKVLPDEAKRIDDARAHMHGLTKIFLDLLESGANTEDRVRMKFESQLRADADTINELRDRLQEAAAKIKEAEARTVDAQKETAAAREQLVAVQARVDKAETDLAQKSQEYSAVQDVLTKLRQDEDERKAKLKEMETGLNDLERLRQENASLTRELEDLRPQAEKLAAAEQDKKDLQEALLQERQMHDADLDEARKKQEELQEKYMSAREDAAKAKEEYAEKLATWMKS